jgi:8-oxo-dGTP pyrophosphatase MutT (NUDIX family)
MNYCDKNYIDEIKSNLSERERRVIVDPAYYHAAVLVPIYKKEKECHILFTKRTDRVKYHKGEISFPGGMVDKEDIDLEKTALREAFEEVGLAEKDVKIIGALDDILTVTGFIVTPFVGLFPYPYPFKLSEVEIAELIEVPLTHLLDEKCFSENEIIRQGEKETVYSFQYKDHNIWGATARILRQFLDLLLSSKAS